MNQADANPLLNTALALQSAGCSVVPTRPDATKAPAAFWKTYQTTRADPDQIRAWLTSGAYDGIGVVTGTISGNLEMLEFEGRAVDEGLIAAYEQALADHGLTQLWQTIITGYAETTPSGGVHVLYRVTGEPRGNTKLARRPARTDELTPEEQDILERSPGKVFARVLIETRGQGGYVVVAPSAGRTHETGKAWTLAAGGPATITTITEEQRDALHDIAALLDTMPPPPSSTPALPFPAPDEGDRTGRPGDAYNTRADWQDILAGHFVRIAPYGTGYTWRRAGKNLGISATTGTRGDGDCLYVFSSSTAFDPERPYTKFAAYALLQHDGDYTAAARELRHQGYGGPTLHGDENLHELIANYQPQVHGPGRPATIGSLATVHQLRPAPQPEHTPQYGTETHRGQLRFAERFTNRWGGEFLHVHGIGWHRYDGARWAPCLDGAQHRAVTTLIKEAFAQLPDLDTDTRDKLYKDIGKIESASGQNGVLELAQNMHPCTLAGDQLDASPYLLNTRSGTVHIETGTVAPPSPGDHLSKVTAAAFDTQARSQVFDEFLERIQPDPDMRGFLARQLGSSLLGVVREHVLFIWYGLGANGKGTLRDAILHALGDYAIEVPAELLLVNRNTNLAPERMRLKGARVAFCSEIGNGAKLDEPTMKKLTGGDPVNAKMLYRNPIQFDPSHTLFMLTNHLPQVRGDDPATWRRIVAVPFGTVIPPGERDGQLPEKLKAVPDAILAWMWRGWLDYQRQGLNPPEAVLAATRKYQLDSDLLARFLADEDAIVLGHGSVGSSVLYRHFIQWCKTEGEEAGMTNKAFTEAMTQRGHYKKKTAAGMVWERIMIATVEAEEDSRWS